MAAKRTSGQTCPLCGQGIRAEGLEALGRHFRTCRKTDRAGLRGGSPAGRAGPEGAEEE